MDVDVAGSGADGFANSRAPRIGVAEGPATPVAGAVVIRAARLPVEGPAVPGPVSKELLRARRARLASAWS